MPATNAISLRDLRTPHRARSPGLLPSRMPPQASLRGLSLSVPQGEAVALLGAAGSGKTAGLLAACGLLELASGRVLIEGRDVTDLPVHCRGLALVGSGRALLGMGPLGQGSVERAVRVAARGLDVRPILEATGLGAAARRTLPSLSPAALRRVALAQAVAAAPTCLLVDEPAAGLDEAGAAAMLAALRAVRESGLSMLVATSSHRTALAVAERGVLLAEGSARQAGWLRELHDMPADDATAGLLGDINRLAGCITDEAEDLVTVRLDCGPIVEARREDAGLGARCVVCVRPGRIALASVTPDSMGPGALSGRVRAIRFLGDLIELELEIGTERARPPETLRVVRPSVVPARLSIGDTVAVAWQPHHAMAFRPAYAE